MPTPPIILDTRFGDWTPSPGLMRIAGTSLAWRSSIAREGVSKLIPEFQGKPRIAAILGGLLAAVQDAEDAKWQVLTLIWLDTAEGVQLDALGLIVDLPRAAWSDDTYRAYLKAQILVLRSDGSWPALVAILRAIAVDVSLVHIERSGMAAGIVRLGAPLTGEITPLDVDAMLERAKSGGVRLTLEYPTAALADTFTWADGDVDQSDSRRGWPSDDSASDGGIWSGELASSEAA